MRRGKVHVPPSYEILAYSQIYPHIREVVMFCKEEVDKNL
uniref:Testis cDNA clone: QtsA-10855, similar to human KIAA1753 protein (KIAA1753) n=1 Tax=Macaca fascicularis TaxID=9541 RepID=Q4R927_MACFA|nr:unnamed protein product [Macaca fascicularis]